jgi:general secretion pathway protein C
MTRRLKLLRLVVVLLAAGSIAIAAAPIVWQLRGHDTIIPPLAELRTQPVTATAAIDVEPVLSLSPFGTLPVAQVEALDASPRDLNLSLLGVIVRDDPARSMALISSPDGEANYRIGETIATQSDRDPTLVEVRTNYVTLDLNGENLTLAFNGAEAPEDPEEIPSGEDRLAAIMAVGQGTTISERNDAAQRSDPVTTQDYIDMWRDRIIANPAEVLDAIGLVPTENGYMIAPQHDSGVNRAGLKAGDIVTTLNGQPVGDIDSDRALYDQVAQSGVARIEVERNGRTIVMSFPLR